MSFKDASKLQEMAKREVLEAAREVVQESVCLDGEEWVPSVRRLIVAVTLYDQMTPREAPIGRDYPERDDQKIKTWEFKINGEKKVSSSRYQTPLKLMELDFEPAKIGDPQNYRFWGFYKNSQRGAKCEFSVDNDNQIDLETFDKFVTSYNGPAYVA